MMLRDLRKRGPQALAVHDCRWRIWDYGQHWVSNIRRWPNNGAGTISITNVLDALPKKHQAEAAYSAVCHALC